MTGWRKRQVMEMAREADLIDDTSASDWYVYQLERFAELVRADEREACAKECEGINSAQDYYGERPELICAEPIRARGQA
ncbi:hypothetical protein UFOVP1610_46 [uncultured Caudovirales phage]|uniref:Uncharacterized protein n=1 Tax=uncultured Caudovirales phage TaxID=2100421 RepID=A0A6J5ST51_9CAUD|nr:hypothetical protein UFOVP1610_46 [uncultured Caudovirales phage]